MLCQLLTFSNSVFLNLTLAAKKSHNKYSTYNFIVSKIVFWKDSIIQTAGTRNDLRKQILKCDKENTVTSSRHGYLLPVLVV